MPVDVVDLVDLVEIVQSNMSNSVNNYSDDILQEIPDSDLPALRDIYKEHWPYGIHAYYWIDNYIDWKKRKISDVDFFCPNGQWNDGTFIAIADKKSSFTIFVFTLDKKCNRLREALAESTRIKWNENNFHMFFLSVHEDHNPTLMEELHRREIKILHQDISNLWWITKEEAVKFEYELPSNVYIDSLKVNDVDMIDSVWPHRGKTSKTYLETLITANGGFGLYLKEDNTLCAWIMRNNYGGMAILQTLEEHKRKGYGGILAKYFSKYWAEKGLDIFCFIMTHNKASLSLFQKLGYKKEHGIFWTQCITK